MKKLLYLLLVSTAVVSLQAQINLPGNKPKVPSYPQYPDDLVMDLDRGLGEDKVAELVRRAKMAVNYAEDKVFEASLLAKEMEQAKRKNDKKAFQEFEKEHRNAVEKGKQAVFTVDEIHILLPPGVAAGDVAAKAYAEASAKLKDSQKRAKELGDELARAASQAK